RRHPSARPCVDAEAARHLCGAAAPRAVVSDRDDGSRRGPPGRGGVARRHRPAGARRSDAVVSRPARTGPPAGGAAHQARALRRMDVRSDNFAAELLLKLLGRVAHGRGTTAAGTLAVREALAEGGVPLDGLRMVDGSGLSLLDRVTARTLVGVLRALWDERSL